MQAVSKGRSEIAAVTSWIAAVFAVFESTIALRAIVFQVIASKTASLVPLMLAVLVEIRAESSSRYYSRASSLSTSCSYFYCWASNFSAYVSVDIKRAIVLEMLSTFIIFVSDYKICSDRSYLNVFLSRFRAIFSRTSDLFAPR